MSTNRSADLALLLLVYVVHYVSRNRWASLVSPNTSFPQTLSCLLSEGHWLLISSKFSGPLVPPFYAMAAVMTSDGPDLHLPCVYLLVPAVVCFIHSTGHSLKWSPLWAWPLPASLLYSISPMEWRHHERKDLHSPVQLCIISMPDNGTHLNICWICCVTPYLPGTNFPPGENNT